MKGVVFHGVGDIRLEDIAEPRIEEPTDAILRITASAICGTDLHMVRGTLGGLKPGTVLGHEAVGVVESLGSNVRNLKEGDRVVVPSTVACGYCSYCRAGYYAQCDNANPNGILGGTTFFGGPAMTGALNGLQAEKARIPFANVGLVKLPDDITDDEAIVISDILPTAYFGADLAEIKSGDTVAVFGCGPVGQFSITCAKVHGAGRVLAVDNEPSRLEMARNQGAEVINFDLEDPVQAIRDLTGGIGVDRAIDAVGVDAERPHHGPAAQKADEQKVQFDQELSEIAPEAQQSGARWHHGDSPSLVLTWAVQALAKAGTLSIIGVYPPSDRFFPIGMAMNKNLTLKMGNCNHRQYIPMLIDLVRSGVIDPTEILTQTEPLTSVIEAYRAFDEHRPGWLKVELV
ncbi:alcohol dehydrogenase GroES domain-containing protein [Methylocaldum marinum]|uniref:Alcohol dehydrogenase GroES domain-containing protein n=1 Tax=Methylocaldum marinum TaxID=1432792 RepID=A0A250KSY7_9GAMM|nr:zinc-dependent alcohol dehydrogenase [Methylocaldum marinum]BBA34775.1 alcohol dehydrogenase GroES domain-containing protein [Methylocaldum marinum]